jgi:hypothetical protein
MNEDLLFCQESLFSICQSYIHEHDKKIRDKKTFLTIGRYVGDFDLHSSIDLARMEFQEFTALPFESICLFSKNNGIWYREADLMSFEKPVDTLLQSSPVSV